jgi:hypothetical protein
MLPYADVCCHMLTYAVICCHMLTYADTYVFPALGGEAKVVLEISPAGMNADSIRQHMTAYVSI